VIGASRGRRIGAALGAIGIAALAIGLVVGGGLPDSSQGASTPPRGSGAATVQRRDLVATDTQSGTLSYSGARTVFNRTSGTVTWLPAVGQVVKTGQTLYTVNGSRVVLFDGTTPAYRTLSAGITDGIDVQELNRNLVKLGFDPGHAITINNTWQTATTDAVDRWQSALGQTQTGSVALGQIVFLPGPQRVTAVDTTLGSTGGSSGAGSGSGSTGSGTAASGTSATSLKPTTQFVSLTRAPGPGAGGTSTTPVATASACSPSTATTPTTNTTTPTTPSSTPTTTTPSSCAPASSNKSTGAANSQSLAALIALLKAETAELKKSSTSGSPSSGTGGRSGAGAGTTGTGSAATTGAARASSGGSGSGASAGSGSGSSASGSGSGTGSGSSTAQAILATTSTQLVVTVNLDATKQTEAVVGEPVTVQLPSGGTVDGKITKVSPVAVSSSSSSGSSGSSGGSGGGGSSSQPTATIPVTIALTGHHPPTGLDQAAVSVNFQQQVEKQVLSVPVTALLAQAGGGYAVQEAAAPHRLIAVTPGLFAAGYVQISGAQIYPGLQVTDSQG
jgi:hypothetical protein